MKIRFKRCWFSQSRKVVLTPENNNDKLDLHTLDGIDIHLVKTGELKRSQFNASWSTPTARTKKACLEIIMKFFHTEAAYEASLSPKKEDEGNNPLAGMGSPHWSTRINPMNLRRSR